MVAKYYYVIILLFLSLSLSFLHHHTVCYGHCDELTVQQVLDGPQSGDRNLKNSKKFRLNTRTAATGCQVNDMIIIITITTKMMRLMHGNNDSEYV